jgi:iron complex transport system ATP-binding protein
MVTHVSDVLDLIGVSVLREGQTLLDGVTWRVREGERWVILGPNGAGKTTLLQITGARMHPTTGSASILGETLGAVDVFELRPRIGLSSAAFAERLPPAERVGDVVLTAAYAVAGRWRESYEATDHRRSDDLLAAFGVAHLADRTFGTLSEGERKRVQLARSLMTDPEIVLLDEPAAGLDLGGRETLVRDLAELAGDRRSPVLVLVTHHVEEIPPGFTHALLMRAGRVVAAGPLEETITDEHLSATFDVPLIVEHSGDRWTARLREDGDEAHHGARHGATGATGAPGSTAAAADGGGTPSGEEAIRLPPGDAAERRPGRGRGRGSHSGQDENQTAEGDGGPQGTPGTNGHSQDVEWEEQPEGQVSAQA